MVVNGVVLTQLKRFKTVYNYYFYWLRAFHLLLMEQETVPAQPGYMPVDCFGSYFEIPGNLSVSHSANSLHNYAGIEVRTFLPVVLRECLGAETLFAGLACKPLDTVWGMLSLEVANLFVKPKIARVVVMIALRVWAEGRSP